LLASRRRPGHRPEAYSCACSHRPGIPGTHPRQGHGVSVVEAPEAGHLLPLRAEGLGLKGHNVRQVLRRLNAIIRGWANHYRTAVSSGAFARMDAWMYRRARRYVRGMHRNMPWKWCRRRYWGKLHPERDDHGVFGDRRSGAYLLKFGRFKIARHVLVRGAASPMTPVSGNTGGGVAG
jgi:hypothetical protein